MALVKNKPLIEKFKTELTSGLFDLVNLVSSFEHFLRLAHTPNPCSDEERFYQRYRFLTIVQNKSPKTALDILRGIEEKKPAVHKKEDMETSQRRRNAFQYTGSDGEDARKKLMEDFQTAELEAIGFTQE